MRSTPRQQQTVRTRYWLEGRRRGNFGDALNRTLLRGLGHSAVPSTDMSPSVNPQRCLFAVGSVVESMHIRSVGRIVDVWGAGWRGEPLSRAEREALEVHAVRGPVTARALGVDVPLGDPALLLPTLRPDITPDPRRRGALFVPHALDTTPRSAADVGCSDKLEPWVTVGSRWPGSPPTAESMVRMIASSEFVLTGSLHAAITAAAYGIPWAPWSRGHIDCPTKWLDWAEYLGIDLHFSSNRAAGERWWSVEGSGGRLHDLRPLLDAYPYGQKWPTVHGDRKAYP